MLQKESLSPLKSYKAPASGRVLTRSFQPKSLFTKASSTTLKKSIERHFKFYDNVLETKDYQVPVHRDIENRYKTVYRTAYNLQQRLFNRRTVLFGNQRTSVLSNFYRGGKLYMPVASDFIGMGGQIRGFRRVQEIVGEDYYADGVGDVENRGVVLYKFQGPVENSDRGVWTEIQVFEEEEAEEDVDPDIKIDVLEEEKDGE